MSGLAPEVSWECQSGSCALTELTTFLQAKSHILLHRWMRGGRDRENKAHKPGPLLVVYLGSCHQLQRLTSASNSCREATGDGKRNMSPQGERCSDIHLLAKQRCYQVEHEAGASRSEIYTQCGSSRQESGGEKLWKKRKKTSVCYPGTVTFKFRTFLEPSFSPGWLSLFSKLNLLSQNPTKQMFSSEVVRLRIFIQVHLAPHNWCVSKEFCAN
jgi:hypothetical protein